MSVGLGLFASSIFIMILGRRFVSRPSFIAKSTKRSRDRSWSTTLPTSGIVSEGDEEYNNTLLDLFRAVKNPSARGHKHKFEGSSDLFEARKRYFLDLSNECGLNEANVIHIAGTKGKGSVVEYISACLRNSHDDSDVGIFTSPHLHTARERVKLGSKLISKEDLTRLGRLSLDSMGEYHWTVFFDLLLACSIRYFGENKTKYVVLETGIGGRYDSTNFFENPKVGVITSISYDHTAILGETLEKIAWQKIGIAKKGMHIFTPESQESVVLDVIKEQCDIVGAILHIIPVDLKLVSNILKKPSEESPCFDVQVQNACLARSVVEHLQLDPSDMQAAYWPCRMEGFRVNRPSSTLSNEISDKNNLRKTQNAATVVLDGAHNGDSVTMFLSGLRMAYPNRHIRVLFGAGIEKSLNDMLEAVEKHADSVVLVQSRHFKSASEGELHEAATSSGYNLRYIPHQNPSNDREVNGTVARRLKDAILNDGEGAAPLSNNDPTTGPGPVIAVCGSLFAAAEAREALFALERELFNDNDWVRFMDRL